MEGETEVRVAERRFGRLSWAGGWRNAATLGGRVGRFLGEVSFKLRSEWQLWEAQDDHSTAGAVAKGLSKEPILWFWGW